MSHPPDLREIFDPPDEIIQAGLNGKLVLFVGAGASALLGLPSWPDLAGRALEELRKQGFLNFSHLQQFQGLDAKKQLSIAYLVAEENGYNLKLGRHLDGATEGTSIYTAINDIGCPCVTTNYDELLAPQFMDTKDGSKTASPCVRVADPNKFLASLLDDPGTVIHLHGSISKPETMVVTTRQYLSHYDDQYVQHFLHELFEKKTILFVGYGLEEAEILEHILRRGRVEDTKVKRRFALQGFFRSQEPLYESLHNYYQKSFGVHLLGFVRDHENYNCLERIIRFWAPRIEVRKPLLAADNEFLDEVLGD